MGVICWSLWLRRNRWVWDKVNTSVFGIKAVALNLVVDWKRARQVDKVNTVGSHGHGGTWCTPPEGWIKINVDAAWREGEDWYLMYSSR